MFRSPDLAAVARKAWPAALLATLAACGPVAPPSAVAPPVAPVALPQPPTPLTIVDPPVEPGRAVLVARTPEPRPVVFYEQAARLSPPGAPTVLPPPIPNDDRQETLVEAVPSAIVIGGREHHRFIAFLREAGRGRFDALHLELRSRSRSSMRSLAAAAHRAGVDPLKIRTVDAGSGGRVEVIATRYVASAPACPSLAVVGPSVNDNDFDPTHGCSNRANLAAMVNDPADLVRNGAVVPADGARAAIGIERYRAPALGGPGARSDGSGGQAPIDPGNGLNYGPPGGSVLGAGGPVSR